jgi:ribosomal protein L14
MILRSSNLYVCDKSGVKTVKCIGFLKSIFTKSVGLNEVIRVCIKRFDRQRFFVQHAVAKKGKAVVMARVVSKELAKYDKKKVLKTDSLVYLYLAVIISTSKKWRRRDGVYLRTHKNRAIFLDNTYKLRSSRFVGPINKELRLRQRQEIFYKSIFLNAKWRF